MNEGFLRWRKKTKLKSSFRDPFSTLGSSSCRVFSLFFFFLSPRALSSVLLRRNQTTETWIEREIGERERENEIENALVAERRRFFL